MPTRKKKSAPKRRRKVRPEAQKEYGGFSFLGLIAGLAIIAAGVAYAYGWFPQSFDTASFQMPDIKLPEMPKIEVPHNN